MTQTSPLQAQAEPSQAPSSPQQAPLFRKEAVIHQIRRLDGEVLLVQSFPTRALAALGVAIVAAAALFVSTANYSRMETVPGWVVPQDGLIRVSARQGGIVEAVSVNEGDNVAAGQALATLRLSSNLDAGNAGVMLAAQLEAEIAAARAQTVAAREKLVAEQRQVSVQRAGLGREIDENRQRLQAMNERMELVRANVERTQQLADRGFASRKVLEDARLAELTVQQELAQMRATILNYERQMGDLDARLVSLPLDLDALDAQSRATLAGLAQKRTEAATRHDYVAGATIGGKIVAIPVTRGQDIAAGAVIAVLTPTGSNLEAELYVPSRAAGFIKPGQEVRLMYQAFPYQKFGTARGRVHLVSRTVLSPAEVTLPAAQLREPVFRVKVRLERDSVSAYGQDIPIQPGMLLTADVLIDRRTLLQWLLDPIYAAGRMG